MPSLQAQSDLLHLQQQPAQVEGVPPGTAASSSGMPAAAAGAADTASAGDANPQPGGAQAGTASGSSSGSSSTHNGRGVSLATMAGAISQRMLQRQLEERQ